MEGPKPKPGGPKPLSPTAIALIVLLCGVLPIVAALVYVFRLRVAKFLRGSSKTTADADYYETFSAHESRKSHSSANYAQAYSFPVVIIPENKH